MKIHIPNSAFLGNINPFLYGFDPTQPETLELTTNKKWMSVHPIVLCMITALGIPLIQGNIRCDTLEAKSKHYLERMGLFKFLNIDSGIKIQEHELAGRFIPLTQIENSDQLSHFIQDMTPLLHLEPKQAEPIRYIMSELIRNVLEHSLSKYGAIVSAQYHDKSKTVRIGIADTGIGIYNSIKRSHYVMSDMEALQLALTPGITGTTAREGGTDYNAGAGLFFIKSIAVINRDFFVLYSGKALYKLLKRREEVVRLYADPLKDRHSKAENMPYWQGTLVGIDISLENLQQFPILLEMINKTYSKTIQERRKAQYKQPRFIP